MGEEQEGLRSLLVRAEAADSSGPDWSKCPGGGGVFTLWLCLVYVVFMSCLRCVYVVFTLCLCLVYVVFMSCLYCVYVVFTSCLHLGVASFALALSLLQTIISHAFNSWHYKSFIKSFII